MWNFIDFPNAGGDDGTDCDGEDESEIKLLLLLLLLEMEVDAVEQQSESIELPRDSVELDKDEHGDGIKLLLEQRDGIGGSNDDVDSDNNGTSYNTEEDDDFNELVEWDNKCLEDVVGGEAGTNAMS